ncbi:MAG: nicotinate phosphoribosyltransferase [Aquificae bacterium]|nr:nicotinate phosphoribosyltransferase [Aquificota bacterium]
MLYFIADTHFYHENILNLSRYRFKFFERVILQKLCRLPKEAVLFHLGDFTWHFNDFKGYLELWSRLPFEKYLVLGNHDRRPERLSRYFKKVLGEYALLRLDGLKILLSHYPALDPVTDRYPEKQEKVRELYFKHGCGLLVHGHVHRNEEGIRCGCAGVGVSCFNANVEWNGYGPVSLRRVLGL